MPLFTSARGVLNHFLLSLACFDTNAPKLRSLPFAVSFPPQRPDRSRKIVRDSFSTHAAFQAVQKVPSTAYDFFPKGFAGES